MPKRTRITHVIDRIEDKKLELAKAIALEKGIKVWKAYKEVEFNLSLAMLNHNHYRHQT